MKARPIDKRTLIHKVKWTPRKLLSTSDTTESYEIDKVRLTPMIYFFPIGNQQTNLGNWRLFYCPHSSTKIKNSETGKYEIPKFSIGDTIEFLSAPEYPKLTTILTVTPQWDLDGKSVHHYEIQLR